VREDEMVRIVEEFNTDREFRISQAFLDGGIDPLFGRLHRAALDQLCGDKAALSRYGIWANTVRDNIRQVDIEIENENLREAHRLLYRAANSLSAFAELQGKFTSEEIEYTDMDIMENEFEIPTNRFDNKLFIIKRVGEANISVAGSLKSTLSYLYFSDGPKNLPRERLKVSESYLEPREIVLARWLQTRTNGSLRSKYGVKALLAARSSRYKCASCGFADIRALHLDHVEGHTADTEFACLCANCHNIKSREHDWSGERKY